MSADPAPIPLDDLLAHRAWVRALAVALTRDENEADDFEYEVRRNIVFIEKRER